MKDGISSDKTSILAVTILAAVTVLTISVLQPHNSLAYNIKSTKIFSNSGNNQETYQDCGNSCTVSSSDIISRGSVVPVIPGLPDLVAIPTVLSVSADYSNGIVTVEGRLAVEGGGGLGGLTITVTTTEAPSGLVQTQTTTTDSNGLFS